VTAVESADEAVALLANGTMADILLARWAREHRPEVAILLQTGFFDSDARDFSLLCKPHPPEELSARLRAIVADRREHQDA
jgi:DNA-binding response OmpR family regulator